MCNIFPTAIDWNFMSLALTLMITWKFPYVNILHIMIITHICWMLVASWEMTSTFNNFCNFQCQVWSYKSQLNCIIKYCAILERKSLNDDDMRGVASRFMTHGGWEVWIMWCALCNYKWPRKFFLHCESWNCQFYVHWNEQRRGEGKKNRWTWAKSEAGSCKVEILHNIEI